MKQEPYWPGYAAVAAEIQRLQRIWGAVVPLLGMALSVSFYWGSSHQGHNFWNEVYENVAFL